MIYDFRPYHAIADPEGATGGPDPHPNEISQNIGFLSNTGLDPMKITKLLSQGSEKSQPPEVGIEPGPQELKANTLPRRC